MSLTPVPRRLLATAQDPVDEEYGERYSENREDRREGHLPRDDLRPPLGGEGQVRGAAGGVQAFEA